MVTQQGTSKRDTGVKMWVQSQKGVMVMEKPLMLFPEQLAPLPVPPPLIRALLMCLPLRVIQSLKVRGSVMVIPKRTRSRIKMGQQKLAIGTPQQYRTVPYVGTQTTRLVWDVGI